MAVEFQIVSFVNLAHLPLSNEMQDAVFIDLVRWLPGDRSRQITDGGGVNYLRARMEMRRGKSPRQFATPVAGVYVAFHSGKLVCREAAFDERRQRVVRQAASHKWSSVTRIVPGARLAGKEITPTWGCPAPATRVAWYHVNVSVADR